MTALHGQVAIITGASMGIGKAITCYLAAEGMKLVLSSRNQQKLEALAESLKEQHPDLQFQVVPADVREPEQVQHVVDMAIKKFGRVDVLVNNAGVAGKIALLHEIPIEEIHRTIDTNLKGPIYAMRAVLPVMVQQQEGTIININSVAGKTAFPYWSLYDASKFGLHAITEAAAEEQRCNNIKVVGIYPGTVDTPIWETIELNHEPRKEGMLDADTVAEAVVYVLRQPKKVFISDMTLVPLHPAL